MRGVGGLLLTPQGERFVNELAPRDKVVDGQWATSFAEFALLLSEPMAKEAGKHTDLYLRKGLLTKHAGVDGLAAWLLSAAGPRSSVNASTADESTAPSVAALAAVLRKTLAAYNAAAEEGRDGFGKVSFRHAPLDMDGTLYSGRIVPVLHYTMGGITMDEGGRVLRTDGKVIERLSAAGEVTGGVHGNNRLGGNSLLECTVFGSIVGTRLPIASLAPPPPPPPTLPVITPNLDVAVPHAAAANGAPDAPATATATGAAASGLRTVSAEELSAHKSSTSCWVSLYGTVYDFTNFLEEHPAGAESILKLGGTDGTEMYETVHNLGMLDDFKEDIVGKLA